MLWPMSSGRALLPLAALTFVVALATSRFGLLVHEGLGHGGTAIALGGRVEGLRLFWFGGGWVSYRGDLSTADALAFAMGGIATEWIAAAVLAVVARRRTGLTRVVVAGAATGFAIHGGMYLAVGTFYGSGDGMLLHQLLGAWRPLVWAPAAAICVVCAYAGATAVVPALRRYAVARAPAGQLVVIGAALVIGGLGHVALLKAEQAVRVDQSYVTTMMTESQRQVETEVTAAMRARPQATEAELAAVRRAAEDKNRQFPFAPLLALLIAVSALAAMLRTPAAAHPEPLPWRQVAGPATVCAVGIFLVAVIDAVA